MLKSPADRTQVDVWKEVTLIYESALKVVGTKLEILNNEFRNLHSYNPIEHVKARLKTPESIVRKLKKRNLEVTIENMIDHVHDIAGIRIICSFAADIYNIAGLLAAQSDVHVVSVRDYIHNPKTTGYKSYHMLVNVPINLSYKETEVMVEIQIRTVAMDFWATLEHKIHYKFEGRTPEYIRQELIRCADMVADLDDRMYRLNEEVRACVDGGDEYDGVYDDEYEEEG